MEIHTVIIDPEPGAERLAELLEDYFRQLRICGPFSSYSAARDAISRREPGLILWNLSAQDLPDVRALRCSGVQAPLIVLTRRADAALLERLLSFGVSDLILQPFEPGRLCHSVHLLLEQKRILEDCHTLTQPIIDRMLHFTPPIDAMHLLPKGLSQRTLARLELLLQHHGGEDLTCEELADLSGLSRVTVRKYLTFLMGTGQLTSGVDYATGGRPRVLYHIT